MGRYKMPGKDAEHEGRISKLEAVLPIMLNGQKEERQHFGKIYEKIEQSQNCILEKISDLKGTVVENKTDIEVNKADIKWLNKKILGEALGLAGSFVGLLYLIYKMSGQ